MDNGQLADLNIPVSTNQSISTGVSGQRRAILRNAQGNYILTQAVNLPFTLVNDTNDPPEPPTPTGGCYEAESGSRSPGTDLSSGGNASGGQYVGGFDGASRYVDFTVNVTSAGNFPLTFYYGSGEAGGYIDHAINGGSVARLNGISTTGGWNQFAASNAVTLVLNAGNNTIRVQGGFRFTLDKICLDGGSTPPPTPPSGSFALNPPTLDCGSGNVVLSVVNSNGSTVEYRAIGLRDWETGNVLNVPSHQRNGTTFTFQARQSGTEVSQSLTTNCAGYRLGLASSEPVEDADTGLVISPNPSSGRVSGRFRLGVGERGSLLVQSLTGAVLQSRAVVGTGATQTEVLDMEGEPSGLYLIRVIGRATLSNGSKAQTGRVLLMR